MTLSCAPLEGWDRFALRDAAVRRPFHQNTNVQYLAILDPPGEDGPMTLLPD